MCPPCLQPSRGQHRPKPRNTSALWLRLLLFTPLQTLLHSLSTQEPTSPLLGWVQPMGFKTQSLVMFYAQPEPRSRHMLHRFPTTGFNKSSSLCPGPVLISGLSLGPFAQMTLLCVAVPRAAQPPPAHVCSFDV